MKIELKNVKYFASGSEETPCFTATIYVDGVKVGEAANQGHGGCTDIRPFELNDRLNAYGKTLPMDVSTWNDPNTGKPTESVQTGESIIDDLLTDWLIESDVKKAMAKRIMFTKANIKGVFETKGAQKADVLKKWLSDPTLATKLDAEKVLNLLPLSEAVAIYKQASV